MKTTCKDCIFAEWRHLNLLVDPPIPVQQQVGCKADRLWKFENETVINKEEGKTYYVLNGLCNLCTAPSRAQKLKIKTVNDAKKIIAINPLAIVLVNHDTAEVINTLDGLKEGGFDSVCLVYKRNPDYKLVDQLNEDFKVYSLIKFEEDESDDWMVDQAVNQLQPKSYCVFETEKPVPSKMVQWLNIIINEECKPVLMISPNIKNIDEPNQTYDNMHGFWCQTRLHKFWNGNVPSAEGSCLEEKIYRKAKVEGVTHMIYSLEGICNPE